MEEGERGATFGVARLFKRERDQGGREGGGERGGLGVANCLFYENPFLINKYTPLSTVTVVSHFNIATSDQ